LDNAGRPQHYSILKSRDAHESVFALVDDSRDFCSVAPSLVSKMTSATVVSIITNDAQPLKTQDDILVLDVRPQEKFNKCHIQHAISYEKKRLMQDQITPDLYAFKQASNKKLVVYDTDDKTTSEVATLLVNKGWCNVFSLTGGFEETVATYAEICEGQLF